MKNLNIEVTIRYETAYFPSKRHRLQRTKIQQENMTVSIPVIENGEEKIAFKVKTHSCNSENYYYHNEKLWRKIKWSEKVCGREGFYPVKELIKRVQSEASELPFCCDYERTIRKGDILHVKDSRITKLQKFLNNYLIIGNHVCSLVGEPRYVINTFGLGHNHGGTSMFVENGYNSNIPNISYFPADKRKEAIAYGKQVAKRRGDTESVPSIGKYCNIKVLMPELVTCDPVSEHGEGNKFINRLQDIINISNSKNEAGLIVMLATAKELNK